MKYRVCPSGTGQKQSFCNLPKGQARSILRYLVRFSCLALAFTAVKLLGHWKGR